MFSEQEWIEGDQQRIQNLAKHLRWGYLGSILDVWQISEHGSEYLKILFNAVDQWVVNIDFWFIKKYYWYAFRAIYDFLIERFYVIIIV